ncbi:SMAD/FHA domain-containing protein, partial [Massarina eburnea CBS 473.64]
ARELSPYSARRAMTERMKQEPGSGPPPAARQAQNAPPWVRSVPERQNNGSARASPSPPPHGGPSPRPPREPERDSPRVRKSRDSSPEPYQKPRRSRDRSRDRRRDRSRDGRRDRDRSRDRRRDQSTDRRKEERSRDGKRDRSRDRRKERSKDGKRDRSRDRRKERSKDRRDRSKDGRRDRSRDRRDRSRDRRDRSPPPKRHKHARSPSPHRRLKAPLPSQDISFRGTDNAEQPPTKYGGAPVNMEKPNFKTTGALAKAANKVEGTKISLKYHEPAEARKPSSRDQWRIVVFKGDDVVDTIQLHAKSCWLLGRSVEVVDYLLEHPSSSGQHAVIQFRYIQKTVEDEFGVKKQKGKVKPYIIDLESSNGTELNGKRIEASRYFELRNKDVLEFAGSEREYVVLLPPPE